ncbi:putative molybdenum cofactor guanylyltransferase [Pedobacter glucosidilyticus]|jgi:molybdopterin-guanine dinucleotide biosynthesis protein A|nr:molybdenum cofactor guanylyltransferase [Pedobacter glucosidilyticus]KHJ39400.1 putative molybdenum cofactor guanylyltransferase [Pedobacter glucosidilyticus]
METIAAYILAGGKSSRMGSDKGMLRLNETVFIEHIVSALKGAEIKQITIVSANKNYDFLDCERIEDIYPDKGPVGGIFTALSHTKTIQNIILSVDIPLITSAILRWMITEKDDTKLVTQVKVLDKTSPLIAIYHKKLLSVFENHLKQNHLKLKTIIEEIPHQTLEASHKWCALLQNINTKEDYQNLVQ